MLFEALELSPADSVAADAALEVAAAAAALPRLSLPSWFGELKGEELDSSWPLDRGEEEEDQSDPRFHPRQGGMILSTVAG